MKKTKKIFAVLLTLAMMLVFIPTAAMAETATSEGTVLVTVTNATYDGAPADRQGEFLRVEVQLESGMTLLDALEDACNIAEMEMTFGGYVQSIGGLASVGGASGWFGAVNNWFIDKGPDQILAQNGDWISFEYTNEQDWNNFGNDIGNYYGDFTKTLKTLTFSLGNLAPAFSSDVHEYTLTLPAGTEAIAVSPLAMNRTFMVKTFIGETEYKLLDSVPVTEGTKLTIICGDPEWVSSNMANNVPAETYTVTIALEAAVDNGGGGEDENGEPEVDVTKDNSPETGDSNTMLLLSMMASLSALAAAGVVLTARKKAKQ